MKNMKKLASLLLALVMVFALASTAFAATITITGGAPNSEYAAYKLLDATDLGGEKFDYTVNEKYDGILQTATGMATDAEIVAYIQELDEDGIRAFADAVYAAIKDADPDYTEFSDVEEGYYLIAETKPGDDADTYSLVMLDTAGQEEIKVETKEDEPTVTKEVLETNDSTGEKSWGDSADYDITDDVPYRITGTVSNQYASYKNYYYLITDNMDGSLTYKNDNDTTKVYVVNGEGEEEERVEVTDQFTITVADDAHSFTAEADLKDLEDLENVTINANTKIVVEYIAELTGTLSFGNAGNKNTVTLTYNRDPYWDGTGTPDDTGETPPDTAVVFSYDLTVDKLDEKEEFLDGASFELYKFNKVTGDYEIAVSNSSGGKNGRDFRFKGLDAGQYKLVEAKAPDGYNKAEDIEFVIESTFGEDGLTLVVTDLAGKVISGTGEDATFGVDLNKTDGVVSTQVINYPGNKLPTTGGMGTTLFYVCGGILVLAAAVLLITKKRMKADK